MADLLIRRVWRVVRLRLLVVLFPGVTLAGLLASVTALEAGTIAYVLSNNSLIALDTVNPGAAGPPVTVTGLLTGDTLVGIDFRPQNGFLYGLGYNSTAGTVQLYHVSFRTGVATAVGTTGGFVAADGTPVPITGTNFGFDFNPTVDRIRVVTDAGQNFRINPNTGAFIDGNAGVDGVQMDGSVNGATTTIDAAAYTNNRQNATVTTLYTLSAATNHLFIQNPPNNGTQTVSVDVTLSGSPLDFTAANGFDILPGVNVTTGNAVATGVGFAALTVGGLSSLYTIDLATGVASDLGPIGNGSLPIQGLALQGEAVAGGIPAMALSADGTQLYRFNTASAGAASSAPVTGVATGEVLVGIDWRPQTGQLYGLGVNDSANTATLYLIDPQTGAATAIGTPGQIAFVAADGTTPVDLPPASAGYGLDFNPTVDRVRVVTNTGLNFRVNPNTGAPVDGNGNAADGTNTDGPINGLPMGSTGVSGAAYTNSFGQLLTGGVTTQYVLDPSSNMLFIQNPPNNGTLTLGLAVTLGGSPLDFNSVNGFDIPGVVQVTASGSPAAGLAYAVLTSGASTNLYRMELSTGAAQRIGPVGSGSALAGLALGEPGTGVRLLVTGAGPGGGPHVRVFDGITGLVVREFFAYGAAFTGGVHVALGDINGDGIPDIITGAGAGGGPHVRVIDGATGLPLRDFFAYDPAFTGGVFVAGGDINGDGVPDIITGAGPGGSPQVRVIDGVTGFPLRDFFAYDPAFTGGVFVAAGDINGDGVSDIITGAGPGGRPQVRVIDGVTGFPLRDFFAYDPAFTGGVFVAAGDIDGDGIPDIITGAGPGGGPHVRVFDGVTGLPIRDFFAYGAAFTGGVHVAVGDVSGDGVPDIITGAGPGGGPHVRVFDGVTGLPIRDFFAYGPAFTGGVFVGSR